MWTCCRNTRRFCTVETVFEHLHVCKDSHGRDDISKQMLMADNQCLLEQVRGQQSAHSTLPNTNGAIVVPGTQPSVSPPQQMALLLDMRFSPCHRCSSGRECVVHWYSFSNPRMCVRANRLMRTKGWCVSLHTFKSKFNRHKQSQCRNDSAAISS